MVAATRPTTPYGYQYPYYRNPYLGYGYPGAVFAPAGQLFGLGPIQQLMGVGPGFQQPQANANGFANGNPNVFANGNGNAANVNANRGPCEQQQRRTDAAQPNADPPAASRLLRPAARPWKSPGSSSPSATPILETRSTTTPWTAIVTRPANAPRWATPGFGKGLLWRPWADTTRQPRRCVAAWRKRRTGWTTISASVTSMATTRTRRRR